MVAKRRRMNDSRSKRKSWMNNEKSAFTPHDKNCHYEKENSQCLKIL